jgi:hypothetical protein
MIPTLIIQIALVIVVIRCGYVAFTLLNGHGKRWLDIAFYISVALIALNFLL